MSRTFGFGKPKEAGGYVGTLSSPLFGQSTSMNNGFSDTSNNRKVQFGTQFTF